MADKDLRSVPGWSAQHADKLARAWIDSAEQVVAISATRDGLRSLAEQLEVSDAEARHLVGLARAALPPAAAADLDRPFINTERGMGALRPEDAVPEPPPGTPTRGKPQGGS